MGIDIVSPLRQRMIEDMNARKLCTGTQRSHIRSRQTFCCVSQAISRHGHAG